MKIVNALRAAHRDLACALLVLGLTGLPAASQGQAVLHTLLANGPSSNRVNIVFLAEGYTAAQEDKFVSDATLSLQNLVAADPYQEYQNYFNAYAIFVASEQPGSTHYQYNLNKHTYFNSSYDADTDRILTIPPNSVDADYSHGRGKVDALIAQYAPQCTMPVVLVNDYVDGGAGGPLTLVSMGPTGLEIFMHESGHTLAGLGDEYEATGVPDYPVHEEPNTTQETRRNYIKWNAWIDSTTPIPTTYAYSNSIGLFQGANYKSTGWYRPRYDCRMRTLVTGFCEVCSEALVKSFYQSARPADGFYPSTNRFTVTPEDLSFLSVDLLQPATHGLTVKWLLNGNEIVGETNPLLDLTSGLLTNGTQTITVQIQDETALVRNDPSNLLSQTFSWVITGSELPSVPKFEVSPTNQIVHAGSTVELQASVLGRDPLYFQWRFNGVNLPDQTNETLVLANIQPQQAGSYSLLATNMDGLAFSSNAVLTVMVPLTIVIDGPGTVTPTNSVLWYVPGQTSKLTAKPASGCKFTGWTGGIVTNKTAIQIKVLNATVVTATFTDPVAPTLSITSPGDRSRLTNYPVVVIGKAKDNAGVASVQFRVNGGDYTNAVTTNGWTNWSATFIPRAGSNLFEAASIDNAGNRSATQKRTITFVSLQPIALLTNGFGSITPNLNGQRLEVGKFYTFTGVPARSNLFGGWNSGSRSAALSVVMETNLSLTANFVTNPFIPLKGNYEGLAFTSTNFASNAVGTVKLSVTDQGKFSGRVIGLDTYNISGAFWVDGTTQITLSKASRTPLTLSLQMDLTNGTDSVTGSLSDGNWSVPVQCDLDVYDGKKSIAPEAGAYTLGWMFGNNIDLPLSGDGYATLSVGKDGTVKLTGVLADGKAVTQTSALSKSGQWPLFANPYSGLGSLAGWMQFTNRDASSIEGNTIWIKKPAKSGYLTAGLTNTLETIGSTYNAKARPVLSLITPLASFWGAGFQTPWLISATAANTNGLAYSGTNSLKLTVAPASGLISGAVTAPSIKKALTIKGVVLQQAGIAAGFFQTTNQSGRFELKDGGQ